MRTVFFSEAQFALIESNLSRGIMLVEASRNNVCLEESGFYLMLKGFRNYNRRRFGASADAIGYGRRRL